MSEATDKLEAEVQKYDVQITELYEKKRAAARALEAQVVTEENEREAAAEAALRVEPVGIESQEAVT